jgi:molecular chaperone DnaK
VEKLTSASHKLAEAMYKQAAQAKSAPDAGATGAQSAPTDSGAQAQPKGEGEVIDAEVVDDDKKKQ